MHVSKVSAQIASIALRLSLLVFEIMITLSFIECETI
jgi:hypothetical protein